MNEVLSPFGNTEKKYGGINELKEDCFNRTYRYDAG
jgi:hypothetical protein